MTGAEGLAAAFLGGLLTSASPCVLAAVPVAVGFVGGQQLSPARSWTLALAFVGSMNLALLAMGLAAARLALLLLVAGAMPAVATALMQRFAMSAPWMPGCRSFAVLLAAAGLWWVLQGLAPEWAAVTTTQHQGAHQRPDGLQIG